METNQDISITHSNSPKKPITAFMLFLNEIRDKIMQNSPDIPSTDMFRQAGRLWKDLDEDKKSIYLRQAAVDKERYEKEMLEWQRGAINLINTED